MNFFFNSEDCFRIINGTANCCTNFFNDGNKCSGIVYQFQSNNKTKMNFNSQ